MVPSVRVLSLSGDFHFVTFFSESKYYPVDIAQRYQKTKVIRRVLHFHILAGMRRDDRGWFSSRDFSDLLSLISPVHVSRPQGSQFRSITVNDFFHPSRTSVSCSRISYFRTRVIIGWVLPCFFCSVLPFGYSPVLPCCVSAVLRCCLGIGAYIRPSAWV